MLVIRYMPDDLVEIQTPSGPISIRCNPKGRGRRIGVDAPQGWRITINGEKAIDVLRQRAGRETSAKAGTPPGAHAGRGCVPRDAAGIIDD
jgi:hypothetical protein